MFRTNIYNYPPPTIKNIGDKAFTDCNELKEVHISDLAAWCSINFNGFAGASGNPLTYAENLYLNNKLLTDLIIPEGITYITDYAFSSCKSLTSVVIPNGVTQLGFYAFRKCSALTSVTIPPSVKTIHEYAFSGCTELKEVHVTDIAAWCKISFGGMYNDGIHICNYSNPLTYANKLYLNGKLITDLIIPEEVTSIGRWAFRKCSSLSSVTIPNSVKTISYGAFYGCTSLTSIHIPNSINKIDRFAFYGCSALPITTIPNSVTSIGHYAFGDCTSLTSFTIPNSVTSLGTGVFC